MVFHLSLFLSFVCVRTTLHSTYTLRVYIRELVFPEQKCLIQIALYVYSISHLYIYIFVPYSTHFLSTKAHFQPHSYFGKFGKTSHFDIDSSIEWRTKSLTLNFILQLLCYIYIFTLSICHPAMV